MRTEGRPASFVPITLSAAALLWPALWNGYPLVFSDTGTDLSQAIEGYLGWDRPVFYSLFLYPRHMTITTWPAIAAQALLVAHTLHLLRRTLLPGASAWWLPGCTPFLSAATSLPWFASQLVPDIFTPLLVLVLSLLLFAADRLSPTSDDFRWRRDGPVHMAGGAKHISGEAGAIIAAALAAEPATELRALLENGLRQTTRFAIGDGLKPWPASVTPRIERDFPPFEAASYAAARQTLGTLIVPAWMQALHQVIAAITGGLSTPHDRYQRRIMWLPPLIKLIAAQRLRPVRRG